ncbi:hypothetical protein LCGC14_1679930 [marine sediment metagenome]|uniref:Sialidase domain-containing protein n=1 Tax=marine sediment metagenome TaxID=412755 RepID=A0A0F9K4R8_9ZZZZ
MSDILHLRVKDHSLKLKKGKVTRLKDVTITLKLNRDAVVQPGKRITAKGAVTIQGESAPSPRVVPVPTVQDWVGRRIAIRTSPGRWDRRFDGQHAAADAVLLPDGRVALYYVGAKGDRVSDGGPAFRALGVAFSKDGRKPFTKHPTPVIEYFPQPHHPNAEEEGVFSCAAVVAGKLIWMYYGAIKATGGTSVDVDIFVAWSRDGIHFTDHQKIPGINTSRGEIWPFTALYRDGVHYLWVGRRGRTDLLQGKDPYTLKKQRNAGLSPREKRELGSSVEHLGKGKIAMLYDEPMRVATASITTPMRWTASRRYRMPEGNQGKCWLLDRERERWLLYVLHPDNSAIHGWTAPVKARIL